MFENHTGSSRTGASSWLLPRPGRPRARESGFRGEGTDRSTKTWNHLETMPEGIDQALAKSAKSWPIYLNSKPAMGTSTHTINTLFKRKSLFKPKSQEASSPECQSRLVAPHQEPFAPMFENHTGSSRTSASSWLLPRPGRPRARESGFRGEGTDRSTKTWNHLETMPEGIDQALAKSAKSWPIYLNSKPAMGTSTHTINTLFKRKSLFKPKSQEASSPKCQSRLVAPHQEPFAPMFENHTGSSRTVASSWLLPGLGGRGWPRARESGLRGEGTDRSTKTWNHLETMPEGIDQALAKSGKSWPIYLNSKPAMGTSTHTMNTLFKRKSLFKPKSQEASSPECQSRLVAPHQEPFAPMFENHTGSSRTVASSWLLSPAWWPRARESGFRGEGTDRSTKTWNHLEQ